MLKNNTAQSRKKVVFSAYDDVKNPYYGGGGAYAIHEVAKRLVPFFDITVLTSAYPGSQNLVRDGVRYERFGVSWLGPRVGQLAYSLLLPLQARRRSYDAWIESFTPPFTASLLPLVTTRPVIGLTHSLPGRQMWHRYKIPFHWIEKFVLRAYNRCIALTPFVRDRILHANPRAAVSVIGNGVMLPPASELTEKRRYIGFLGRVKIKDKGLDLLLSAIKKLPSSINIPVMIAGGGADSEFEKLRKLISSLHLEKRITVLGRLSSEDKEMFYRRALCVVIPSRAETLPLVALEALANAAPVVGFSIDGLSWLPNSCGHLVSCFDTDALARAIGEVVTQEGLRDQLSRNARAFAEAFNWDDVAQKYRALIEEVTTVR